MIAVVAVSFCEEDVAPDPVHMGQNATSLRIVRWLHENHYEAIVALRRWISNPALGTGGKVRTAFSAARSHFGDTTLLDLPNIKRVVEECVDGVTFELKQESNATA